jgi:hypothetical protein
LERSCCARGEKEKNLLFAGWHIAHSRAALAAMLIIILFLYKVVKENVFVGRLFFDAFSFQRNLRAACMRAGNCAKAPILACGEGEMTLTAFSDQKVEITFHKVRPNREFNYMSRVVAFTQLFENRI